MKKSRKNIKILHLYYDLMNLYGDWANAAAMARELSCRACDVVIHKKSVGDDLNFSEYDFICVGSGTEHSLIAAMRDLAKHKKSLIRQIEEGTAVLATGNSHELFGSRVIDRNGNRHEMLGLIDFETVQEGARITGDCICEASFLNGRDKPGKNGEQGKQNKPDEPVIGFINRAKGVQNGDIKRPFYVRPGKGANFKAHSEGIIYKNLLGTYLTGPILVRNPLLLEYFASLLTKEYDGDKHKSDDVFFKYQKKAYEAAKAALGGK
ncbi:MAG: hypothetical protein FWH17_03095 [Oscillospiraceae bacterium]|nr:hypothetical protein [Oscillospiraceae bacterium]